MSAAQVRKPMATGINNYFKVVAHGVTETFPFDDLSDVSTRRAFDAASKSATDCDGEIAVYRKPQTDGRWLKVKRMQ